jgi:hypothetical protein
VKEEAEKLGSWETEKKKKREGERKCLNRIERING